MTGLEIYLDKILIGNCIDVLETLPAGSVDVIFADPPYNLQLKQELYRPNHTRVAGVDDPWDRFDSFEDYDRFSRAWLSGCRRVLKDSGTIWVIGSYHNIYRVGAIMQDLDYWILNDVLWIKTNPMPNFKGVRFTNAHETLIWAQKERGKPYTFNHHEVKALNGDLQMRSDWLLPICAGKERIKVNGSKAHATQKPESLLYRVILASSRPGDVILDPFFGTGTTGAVARKLRRHWIGIERDESYARIARERIDAVQVLAEDADIFRVEQPRRKRRIPFGSLLELGLLSPGQELFFEQKPDLSAVILADGRLRYRGVRGSIHQVGNIILNSPCNGWEHWFYEEPVSGKMVVIDRMREEAAKMLGFRPMDEMIVDDRVPVRQPGD
jgi:modification methylase